MLIYTTDDEPGIRRKGAGTGFYYLHPDGSKVTDKPTLDRIRALAIPPAYTDVWICPLERGHLQATGRDARKRKQYRYHPDWASQRNLDKFDRLVEVGTGLPTLRRRLRQDLRNFGAERHEVVAAAVRMIDRLGYRVGNERYLEENQSRGISTLGAENVELTEDQRIEIEFTGKGGRLIKSDFSDALLARAVEACHELPGHRLFTYQDRGGDVMAITSTQINDYLREVYGSDITAKDLRTWRASAAAVDALRKIPCPEDREAEIREAVRSAAEAIANRYATCRKHYVHPILLEHYRSSGKWGWSRLQIPDRAELQKAERLLLRILEA